MAAVFGGLCRERLRGREGRPRAGPCPFPRAQTLPSSRRSPNGHNPVEECNNITPSLGIATPHLLVPAPARAPQQVQTNGRGHVTGLNNTAFVCDSCRDSTFRLGRWQTVLTKLRLPTCPACHDMERWRYPRGKPKCKCNERLEEAGCSECIWQTTAQIEILGEQYREQLKRARPAINGATHDAHRPRGPIRCRCGDLRHPRGGGRRVQNVVLFCLACREAIVNGVRPHPTTLRPRRPIVYPLVDVTTGNLL